MFINGEIREARAERSAEIVALSLLRRRVTKHDACRPNRPHLLGKINTSPMRNRVTDDSYIGTIDILGSGAPGRNEDYRG
jgi:hypothetical protein